jgi:GcrA cell cycle regulator
MEQRSGFPHRSPRHPRSPWTAERMAYVRRRWWQGASGGQIARELGGGASRNAVPGKIRRLDIPRLSPGLRRIAGSAVRAAVAGRGKR